MICRGFFFVPPTLDGPAEEEKIAAYAALQIGIGEVRVKMVTSTGTSPTAFAPDAPMVWTVNTGILSGTSRINLSAQATADELA